MKFSYIFLVLLIFQTSCTELMNLFHSYNYGSDDFADIDPKMAEELTKRFNLPPDPGEKGKETLFGIDADNDGLRDDVQRWIYFHYPDEPLMRKALRQVAIDAIETFKFVDDKEKSIKASRREMDSGGCLSRIHKMINFNNKGWKSTDVLQIYKIIENTEERFKASRKSDSNFSRQIYSSKKTFSACRFEVEHPNKVEYLKTKRR